MNKKKLALMLICVFVGYCIAVVVYYTAPPEVPTPSHIPTPTEIQRMLVDVGHDIEVDGIIGKATLEAWSDAVNNQYASKHDYMYRVTE